MHPKWLAAPSLPDICANERLLLQCESGSASASLSQSVSESLSQSTASFASKSVSRPQARVCIKAFLSESARKSASLSTSVAGGCPPPYFGIGESVSTSDQLLLLNHFIRVATYQNRPLSQSQPSESASTSEIGINPSRSAFGNQCLRSESVSTSGSVSYSKSVVHV